MFIVVSLSLSLHSSQIPMSQETQKEYNDEMSRLKRIYGADKNDLSEFPTFKFD
jgi:cytidylate kinase